MALVSKSSILDAPERTLVLTIYVLRVPYSVEVRELEGPSGETGRRRRERAVRGGEDKGAGGGAGR